MLGRKKKANKVKKLVESIPDDVYERIHPDIIRQIKSELSTKYFLRNTKLNSTEIIYKKCEDKLGKMIETITITKKWLFCLNTVTFNLETGECLGGISIAGL